MHAHFYTNNVDRTPVNLMEEIRTSIENMSMRSLINLAISHRINVMAKMSSDNLKYILSDHLCKGCCLYSTLNDVYK